MRWIWDLSFFGGSLVATFVQGMTVGALVEGLPITNGQYTGGAFGWFSPFAALCGVGLCFGYALLGACWLVRKCEGDVKNAAYRQIPYLSIGLLLFLVTVFSFALAENLQIMNRWVELPYLFIFPAISALASTVLALIVHPLLYACPFSIPLPFFLSPFETPPS